MQTIDPRIFRAYDIRGRAHEQLTEEACYLIGRAFGTEVRERTGKSAPRLCVGRDARTHGPAFEAAVIRGLTETGCTVLAIGQTPSPVNYFTICQEKLDGGIQVTASHNPAHDNGLKFSLHDAEAFAGDDLQELRRRIEDERFVTGEGRVEAFDGITPYIAFLTRVFAGVGKGVRIVVDSGNGVAGPVYAEVLQAVGAEVDGLYLEPDGTFPNHAADPSKWDTLKDLQEQVRSEKADLGLAFDGDGDRLGLVDETGRIRTADEIMLLLSRDHLQRFPGGKIVFTVSNSATLQSEIAAWGGVPVLCKVGHSHVEHTMRTHGSLLGGEQSGHFFCGEDYFPFDDALVAALRILSIVQREEESIADLCKDFPRTYQAPEYRPKVEDDDKDRVMEQITLHFGKKHNLETMDGIRIDFPDGSWVGIRKSNTSPCISICMEARSPKRLAELEAEILGHLKEYPEIQW